jgi:GNAT superfamily N-acetyltransferase
MNIFHLNLEEVVCLWETDGQIVAMLNPDTPGEAFFQVHPSYRRKEILCEMLEEAERRLPKQKEDGKKELLAWVNATDEIHKEILADCGYARSKYLAECPPLCQARSPNRPQGGYTVRGRRSRAARTQLAFRKVHPDEPDEKYQGWKWYRNVQRIPIYRRDLDIVAVASDGELAAFCTVWFDDITRTAVFEPVGTHPNHQKRGLGKAVMSEGLRRAQRLGATLATVSSYSTGAHALYESMGFTEFDLLEPWIKEW